MGVVNEITDISVMQNRGVLIRVHKVEAKETDLRGLPRWERSCDDSGSYLFENIFIKFTNWTIANIEMPTPSGFGGFEDWQEELSEHTNLTVLKTIAHALDRYVLLPDGTQVPDTRYAAMVLLDEYINDYSVVVMNSMLMAQGVMSPESGAEAIKQMLKDLREETVKIHDIVKQELEKDRRQTETPTESQASGPTTQTVQGEVVAGVEPSPESSPSSEPGDFSGDQSPSSGN